MRVLERETCKNKDRMVLDVSVTVMDRAQKASPSTRKFQKFLTGNTSRTQTQNGNLVTQSHDQEGCRLLEQLKVVEGVLDWSNLRPEESCISVKPGSIETEEFQNIPGVRFAGGVV